MDIKFFPSVSHVHSFGKHMPVDSTDGEQFSAVYGYHELAEHIVLASFPFDPGGLLSRGFVFDPGGFMRFLKSFPVACLVLINWMNWEQSVMYYLCNAPNMCSDGCSCFGQLPFRQKGSDNFYIGLSPQDCKNTIVLPNKICQLDI